MADTESTYELWQDGVCVAKTFGPDAIAFREIKHYHATYAQDGGKLVMYYRDGRRRHLMVLSRNGEYMFNAGDAFEVVRDRKTAFYAPATYYIRNVLADQFPGIPVSIVRQALLRLEAEGRVVRARSSRPNQIEWRAP
ncbi:hypothetical protein GCM10009552_15440 [Rothia nasimurium]|uniref:Uncharacterized protein n=1 Tax=Luteibacter anthropi TaxID=564369 RepID=A0A7X5UB85_9GAMM|nr:hypothetical protein [Luteibacter anthropi]NII07210.1 hypothetical protein [Luteibacter anthropi]